MAIKRLKMPAHPSKFRLFILSYPSPAREKGSFSISSMTSVMLLVLAPPVPCVKSMLCFSVLNILS